MFKTKEEAVSFLRKCSDQDNPKFREAQVFMANNGSEKQKEEAILWLSWNPKEGFFSENTAY